MVFAKKRKKTTRRRMQKTPISLLYNILIFSLGFIIVGFVWSFFQNFITEGKIQQDMPVELAGLITATKYEETTGYKIEVEILNGCGVKSLANLYSDFLRDAGFDVIKSANADHFNYKKTRILLRRGEISRAHELARVMQLNHSDINISSNEKLFCDVTLILGSDFRSLPSFNDAIKFNTAF